MKRLIRTLAIGALALGLASCTPIEEYTVPVMLELPNGMSMADNASHLAMVQPGQSAVFPVKLDLGFEVRESDAYTYADGMLTVHDVRYPSTVKVGVTFDSTMWAGLSPDQIPTSGEFLFELGNEDEKLGAAKSSMAGGMLAAATEVTVTATPAEGGRFVCWSLGATVANGGMPLAYTPEYTFRIGTTMSLWANFGTANTATLLYDANGGSAEKGAFARHDTKVDNYIMPHTLPSQGQLTRDGYVLYAYNEAKDGSGREYLFGANVPMPESGTKLLYAQWAKADESLFTYEKLGGGVAITGCSSTDAVVVIPETIGGAPVKQIKAGAFDGLENMTTLITNRNIETYDSFCVRNCRNFTTLYLCDSVKSIPDNFYGVCPEFRTLRLGAVRNPTYCQTRNGTYMMKYQRLLQTADMKKIIVVAGSSSAYGIDSPTFETEMGGEYALVNYGTNQGTSSALYTEFIAHFIKPGDIVILAPEPHQYQLGHNEMNVTTWQIIEGAMEAMQHIDLRQYTKVFSSLTSFNGSRDKMKARSYEEFTNETVNRWGDYSKFKKRQSDKYVNNYKKFNWNADLLTDTRAALLNRVTDMVRTNGGEVYLSFSPINLNYLSDKARTPAAQKVYQDAVSSKLTAIRISEVGDYVIGGSYFFNSDLHLGTEGATMRTKQLAAELRAALGK